MFFHITNKRKNHLIPQTSPHVPTFSSPQLLDWTLSQFLGSLKLLPKKTWGVYTAAQKYGVSKIFIYLYF